MRSFRNSSNFYFWVRAEVLSHTRTIYQDWSSAWAISLCGWTPNLNYSDKNNLLRDQKDGMWDNQKSLMTVLKGRILNRLTIRMSTLPIKRFDKAIHVNTCRVRSPFLSFYSSNLKGIIKFMSQYSCNIRRLRRTFKLQSPWNSLQRPLHSPSLLLRTYSSTSNTCNP